MFWEIPLLGEMGEAQKGCRFRQKKVARHFSVVTEGARFRQREFSVTFVGVGLDRPVGFMPKLDVTRGRAMLAPTIFTYLKMYAKSL